MKKIFFISFVIQTWIIVACNNPENENKKNREFESKTKTYTIENTKGTRIKVTDFGARVMEFWVKDKNDGYVDIVLGFDNVEAYSKSQEPYFGAAIGRYGNRINQGKFKIKDKEFLLVKNDGENSLHGGPLGFHQVHWKVSFHNESRIVFEYHSKDGEGGFPGNLLVKMIYELSEDNEFAISYEAITDKSTVINLTHHSFFNLNGEGESDILNHVLYLNASEYIPVDHNLIPTGEISSVKGTPFDFTKPKIIGTDINKDHKQLKFGKGFDHNWVLNRSTLGELEIAARVYSPLSGIGMEIYTTEPGIQFYSGNFLDGSIKGKNEKKYKYRAAFCLETQHFPDSPNQPEFPETVLNPGEKYIHHCIYKIVTKDYL